MPVEKNLHLIFKTHLDVGFTDSAANVIRAYFEHHIPSALRVARQLRESGSEKRFIWTTGSWLVYEYLEQAAPAERKLMEEAILAGDLKWHALPFTTHTELMDVELFRFGLSLSRELDKHFGMHTTAAKLTDVPGHTRGIIPLLAEAGVRFLHIGVNPGSSVPQVPPLFRWVDPSGADLVVMYESGYGSAFVIEGSQDSLAFGHTGDNLGPQSAQQVLEVYEEMQKQHPHARIFASTLDRFAATLEPLRSSLPVVTDEIGDTWIHGVGSDPIKVAQFRELLRLRLEWLRDGKTSPADPQYKAFNRRLLLIPEHTWGMDEKTHLADNHHYNADQFVAHRTLPNYRKFESSWAEKRAYPQEAVIELENTALAKEARERLASIRPRIPALDSALPVSAENLKLADTRLELNADAKTGAIHSFYDRAVGFQWSDSAHPLAWLRYQTFSAADYDRFHRQYIRPAEQNNAWSREDFTKPGLEDSRAVSRFWQPVLQDARQKDQSLILHLTAEAPSAQEFGCPQDFYLSYTLAENPARLLIELQWFNKNACRMPEACWLSFIPKMTESATLRLEKLGEEIDPLQVVPNGNRHLHAVNEKIIFRNDQGSLLIRTLDAPLVNPGEPSLLDFNNRHPDLSKGVHINLHNNLWGTNFPMWFEEDCLFRFEVIVLP